MRSHALARIDGGLQADLVGLPGAEKPARIHIFTFRVLTHHHDVDIAGLLIGQRCAYARQQLRRTQAYILVEALAHLNQRRQRDVVGQVRWVAHRAQVDGVKGTQGVEEVIGGNLARLAPVPMTPVELGHLQSETETACGCAQHFRDLCDDIQADAVTGIESDFIVAHDV